MPMKRKPAKTSADKVERFINDAKADETSETAELNSVEQKTKQKEKDEKKGKKHSENGAIAEKTMIDEQFERRGRFADNFKRETFYVHKDLAKAIKKQAAKGSKGEKTRIINLALKKYFETENTNP